MTRGRVLIVESSLADLLPLQHRAEGLAEVVTATTVAEAEHQLDAEHVNVVICDWRLTDGSCLSVLRRMQQRSPHAVFVVRAPKTEIPQLRDDPAFEGQRLIHKESGEEMLMMVLQQCLAVSRMRDSAKIRLPVGR